ncbi:hypothetical protein Tco_0676245 [Tanacetum coccineum]
MVLHSPVIICEPKPAVVCVQWYPDKSSVFGSSTEDGGVNIRDYETMNSTRSQGHELYQEQVLGRLCELKTTIDVGLFDHVNSMETIGKQYGIVDRCGMLLFLIVTLLKTDREVFAYKYKHFDAVKALLDNPDLMRSASGDALYGYWVGLNEEMKLNKYADNMEEKPSQR